MYSHYIKVPLERVGVLIGKKGKVKEQIEKITHTRISIDSKEGEVTIQGEDALKLFTAKEVVKAVGRGYNPEIAFLLFKMDYFLEIIDIRDFAGRSTKGTMRLKGRVIGDKGRSRRIIEELTECHISVYGKTIGIIGTVQNVMVARRAIEQLLSGSPHKNVYSFLEGQRRSISAEEQYS